MTTIIMLGCCAILTLFALILIIAMVHYGRKTDTVKKVLTNHFYGIRTLEGIVKQLEKKLEDKNSNKSLEERVKKLEETVDRLSVYVDMKVIYPDE